MGWRAWLERLQGRPSAPPTGQAPVAAPRRTPPRPTLGELGLAMALLDDARGDDACVGCGLCAALCPTRALRVESGAIRPSPSGGPARGWAAAFTLDADACIACELCCQVCPTDALRLLRAPTPPLRGLQHHAALRAAAVSAPPSRRRSPLGPVPGAPPRPAPPPPPRAAPRPRPAADLGAPPPPPAAGRGPQSPTPLHPVELSTSEPTRLETWAHPVDAPNDPESDDVEAVCSAEVGEDPTGSQEATGPGSATRAIVEGLPDAGDPRAPPAAGDAHPAEVDTLPRRPTVAVDPEDTAPLRPVRPPPRPR